MALRAAPAGTARAAVWTVVAVPHELAVRALRRVVMAALRGRVARTFPRGIQRLALLVDHTDPSVCALSRGIERRQRLDECGADVRAQLACAARTHTVSDTGRFVVHRRSSHALVRDRWLGEAASGGLARWQRAAALRGWQSVRGAEARAAAPGAARAGRSLGLVDHRV